MSVYILEIDSNVDTEKMVWRINVGFADCSESKEDFDRLNAFDAMALDICNDKENKTSINALLQDFCNDKKVDEISSSSNGEIAIRLLDLRSFNETLLPLKRQKNLH